MTAPTEPDLTAIADDAELTAAQVAALFLVTTTAVHSWIRGGRLAKVTRDGKGRGSGCARYFVTGAALKAFRRPAPARVTPSGPVKAVTPPPHADRREWGDSILAGDGSEIDVGSDGWEFVRAVEAWKKAHRRVGRDPGQPKGR